MTDLGHPSSSAARLVIVPTTMFALLLPLPASCSRCSANDGKSAAKSGCCQKRDCNAQTENAACVGQYNSRCSCCIQPTDRSTRQSDRPSPLIELSGALSFAVFAPCDCEVAAPGSALTRVDLVQQIPHRILHCSWQI
jgi:hypothetical protein